MKPNLFKYATSELSQDAFLCWLFEWATPECQDLDPALHETSISLIKELTDENIEGIQTLDIKRQDNNVDIVLYINDNYALIIEDKVHAGEHGDQLERYAAQFVDEFNGRYSLVYLKTGDQSQYRSAKDKGYKVFHRKDLLKILKKGISDGTSNNIFLDFYEHLQAIEESVNSYLTLPIGDWTWDSWKGFYIYLQGKVEGAATWKYVPQKNGGFLGFWWCFREKEINGISFQYYLQLEMKKFCFKIIPSLDKEKISKEELKQKRRQVRNAYRSLLFQEATKHGISITRNGSLGATMTVAKLDDDIRQKTADGLIDLKKTVTKIKGIEAMLLTI
jgi:hypothetical protein